MNRHAPHRVQSVRTVKNHHTSVGKHPDRLAHPALAAPRRHAEEPSDQSAGGFSAVLRGFLLPPAVVTVAFFVSVTVLTAVADRSQDPTALVPGFSAAALAVASLAGGVTAGLCRRTRAVASGLLCGLLLSVLLCTVGLASGGDPDGGMLPWLLRLSPIPVSGLGGLLTRPRKKVPAHRKGTSH